MKIPDQAAVILKFGTVSAQGSGLAQHVCAYQGNRTNFSVFESKLGNLAIAAVSNTSLDSLTKNTECKLDRASLLGLVAAKEALAACQELGKYKLALNLGCARGPTATWEHGGTEL